jgi:hypothetical protein
MIEISESTAELGSNTADWSALRLGRLARCQRLSATWQLYLGLNEQLRSLLEYVGELSYRDCIQHGLKAEADRLVQAEA